MRHKNLLPCLERCLMSIFLIRLKKNTFFKNIGEIVTLLETLEKLKMISEQKVFSENQKLHHSLRGLFLNEISDRNSNSLLASIF